jgi:pyruvate dehydrogenase E2 component (dihydrolipoamide acetyltransferase)
MPALSPTMEEGTLAKWLVKEGDTVNAGDLLAEIETDKATMEFEAVDEGVIGKILIGEGTEGVKVNTPIALLIGDEGEDMSDAEAAAPSPPADAGKEAAADGGSDAPAAPAPSEGVTAAPAAPVKDGTRLFASPLARRIAADKGLDLAQITGSGPHGRIVKADVENAHPQAAKTADAPRAAKEAAAPSAAAMPTGPEAETVRKMFEGREFEEVTLNGMRKTVAARLTEAKQTIPHFYLRRDIQLDALLTFRGKLNKQLEPRGVKLSVNDFIIKACAQALQTVPDANAVWAGDRILKLAPSDVGVAVAVDGGLFVPVLKDSEQKSLSALSTEMGDLATRARDGTRSRTSACSASRISTRSSTRRTGPSWPWARVSRSPSLVPTAS